MEKFPTNTFNKEKEVEDSQEERVEIESLNNVEEEGKLEWSESEREFLSLIKAEKIASANRLTHLLTPDFMESAEVQSTMLTSFLTLLENADVSGIGELKPLFVPDSLQQIQSLEVQSRILDRFLDDIERGFVYGSEHLKTLLTTDFLQSPEIQNHILESFLVSIERGHISEAENLESLLIFDPLQQIQSPEAQSRIFDSFLTLVRNRDITNAKKIKTFFTPDSLQKLESQEAQSVILDIFSRLSYRDEKEADVANDLYSLLTAEFIQSSEEAQSIFLTIFLEGIEEGDVYTLGNTYSILTPDTQQQIQTPEIQSAILTRFLKLFEEDDVWRINELQHLLTIDSKQQLQTSEVQGIILTCFLKLVEEDKTYGLKVLQPLLTLESIQSPEVQDRVLASFLKNVAEGEIVRAEELQPSLTPEFIQNPEVQDRILSTYSEITGKFNLDVMLYLNNTFAVDPKLKQLIDIYGDNLTSSIYRVGTELLDGKISDEAEMAGVTKTGEEGIVELLQIKDEIVKTHLSGDAQNAESIIQSPLLSDLFKNAVRYEQSEWGGHDDLSFKQTLQTYEEARQNGKIEGLPSFLSESEVIQVPLRERTRVPISESAINRYGVLRDSLSGALTRLESTKKPLTDIASLVDEDIQNIITNLENKLQTVEREEARIGINNRIQQLESIDVRSVENFQETVQVLGRFPELHDTMREAIFLYALARHREVRGRAKGITEQDVSIESISNLLEFVDHIVNQETFSEYFTDKRSAEMFRKITSVEAFSEELQRTQKFENASTETVPIKFIPTRGLLAEFSGHIADACWASKHDSVLGEFPTISHVMLVKHPGDPKKENIIGACLLIETMSDKGEPVLAIRGLNPQESEINKLSIPDFTSVFTDWIKEAASKNGSIPAIIIDDHSGGASTNRPKLFAHLQNIEGSLEKVQLNPEQRYEGAFGWSFNGYDNVDKHCYRLDKESEREKVKKE